MKTASLSSYPIVLIEKFCAITLSCPPIAATHDSAPELMSLALRSTNHVQYQQAVEHTERGYTLSCRVRGFFQTEESRPANRMWPAGGAPSAEGLDRNRALYILSVRGNGSGLLAFRERSGGAAGRCAVARRYPQSAYATCMLHQTSHRPS